MGGGQSAESKGGNAASPPPKQPTAAEEKKKARAAVAHSAPAASDQARRKSSVGAGGRRGSMMPAQMGKAPSQANLGGTLNNTHLAMRGSTVARTRLTRDKVTKLARNDDFDDTDEEDADIFGKDARDAAEEEEELRRRAKENDTDAAAAKFGRRAGAKGNGNAHGNALGNEAGGDMSGAAAGQLAGGIGKKDQVMARDTTVTGRRQRAFFNNDDDLEDEPVKTTSALATAKKQAKTAGVQQELQRRQTARETMGGTLNQTKSFGGTLAAQSTDGAPMTNGTPKVKQLLDQMRQFRHNMRAKRDMSDTDITELQMQQQQYANVKLFIAKELAGLGRRVEILARQVRDQCVEFVDSIIQETDVRGGNLEVVAAFMKHLCTIEWTEKCLQHNWIETTARDGSVKFFDLLLQLPRLNDTCVPKDPEQPHGEQVELEPVKLLQLVVDHKSLRLALSLVVLKHWSTMNVAAYKEEMAPMWQRIFEDAASAKRAIPNEDRQPRMTFIGKVLSLSHLIRVDFHRVDPMDHRSIITRSVAENDTQMFAALISNATDVDWNFIYPDGHSPLTTAVQANSKLMVELLLGVRTIDVFLFVPAAEGHALDFARKIKAHAAVIAAIEHKIKGATTSTDKAGQQSTGNAHVAKKRAAAAEKLEAKLPDYIANPPAVPPGQDTPDWVIDTSEKPLVATEEVLEQLNRVADHQRRLFEAKRNLLSDPAAEALFFELDEGFPAVRGDVADKLMALGPRISVEGREAKEHVAKTVDTLLADQEVEGNPRLLRVIMYRIITVDFAPLITQNKWALNAVQAANLELLASLFKVSKLWAEEDVLPLFDAALAHPTKRIPLINVLLKHHDQLRLSTHGEHLRSQFQSIFDELTNRAKLLPAEDLAERQEVLFRLCSASYATIQYEAEFTGSQTVFSRACREGDIEVVKVMTELRMLRDINRVHSNKSTALMQAVVGNQVEIVTYLAADPSVEVAIRSPHGTALELAQKMRKDPAIIKALKAAGG